MVLHRLRQFNGSLRPSKARGQLEWHVVFFFVNTRRFIERTSGIETGELPRARKVTQGDNDKRKKAITEVERVRTNTGTTGICLKRTH